MKGMKTLFRRIERLESRLTQPPNAHDLELVTRLDRGRARLGEPPLVRGEDRRPCNSRTIIEILNSGLRARITLFYRATDRVAVLK